MTDPDVPSRRGESAADRLARLEAEALEGPIMSESAYRAQTRRSFLTGAAGMAAGYIGWRWLQGRPEDGNVPDVLRQGYEFNEELWQAIGSQSKLAPTFRDDQATSIRVNGRHGIREEIDLDAWELQVVGVDGNELERIGLDAIEALPQTDFVVEHKCIEGWSARPHWAGAVFGDFAARYTDDIPPDYDYVAMETPDGDYYVGVDRATMLNRQTLLVTHLNGEPLTQDHGAPLRMATPHKYGIKSIKRIGTIRFTNERPPDYWAERGYTYWAGF